MIKNYLEVDYRVWHVYLRMFSLLKAYINFQFLKMF